MSPTGEGETIQKREDILRRQGFAKNKKTFPTGDEETTKKRDEILPGSDLP